MDTMDSYDRGDSGRRNSIDDYNRRRSDDNDPYVNRRARNRDRSRSPPRIDRYQPDRTPRDRPPYFRSRDDVERRRRTPPPNQPGIDRYVPGHDQPAAPPFNPIPNPLSLPQQVGFPVFAEWWRVEKQVREEKERQSGGRRPERTKAEKQSAEERTTEREQIQVAYDSYKEKLQAQMARTFVQEHKGEEWFKERYDPEVRATFRVQLNQFRRSAYEKWQEDLRSAIFDEFTLEGIYKSDSNGAGGVVEKEEGEAAAANEVLGVGDLLPTRGGDLRDEAAHQPTLLVKTIAPTVSRAKMEEFCKEHLGDGEGGFRWLSLSDPNPQKKYHRIGWVILKHGAEHGDIEERSDPRDIKDDDGEGAMEFENQVPASTAHKALDLINGKTIHDAQRGDFTCHVGIHEPPAAPRKKALWDLFSAPERIERDLQLAIRLTNKLDEELSQLGEPVDSVITIEKFVEELRSKGWLQPPVNAPAAKKRVKVEDPDEDEGALDEEEEEGAVEDNDDVDDEELLSKKKRLDLLVEYLRRVYSFCMFCVFESDSIHELTRKCPGGHLRRPRSTLTTNAKVAAKASARGEQYPFKKQDNAPDGESGSPVEERKPFKGPSKSQQQLQRAFNWVKTYEEKLLQVLDPENADVKKLGGKPVNEALEEELSKFVNQEDESRFRCKVPDCTKLFKGQHFWRKHVEKRHDDFFNKIKYDVTLINTYVVDPSHIAPSRSDATSNGHFPLRDHGPMGTQRGLNPSNFQANFAGFPGLNAGNGQPPNMMHIAALMAQNGINPGIFTGQQGGDGEHMAGPMRRGRGQGSRAGGPYDRPGGKDQRNARWGGAGRLSPPPRGAPGLGRPIGPPRFGEGGAGPREAVQGRSIRSYEDLDAAGSGGADSLDY